MDSNCQFVHNMSRQNDISSMLMVDKLYVHNNIAPITARLYQHVIITTIPVKYLWMAMHHLQWFHRLLFGRLVCLTSPCLGHQRLAGRSLYLTSPCCCHPRLPGRLVYLSCHHHLGHQRVVPQSALSRKK